MTNLDKSIEWANKLLNYACASERHEMIKEYPAHIQQLMDAANALQSPRPIVFTPEEVINLNEYQRAGRFHPFTCGNDRCGESHGGDKGDGGILVATVYGWICLFCDWKQNWCHDFMKEPKP